MVNVQLQSREKLRQMGGTYWKEGAKSNHLEKNSSSALDLAQIRGTALFIFMIRKVKRVNLGFGQYYGT